MKIDIFNDFKIALTLSNTKPSTQERRFFMLKQLLKNQDCKSVAEIDHKKLLEAVQSLNTDTERRIAKSTLDIFKKLGFNPTQELKTELNRIRRISGKRVAKAIDNISIESNINSIRNPNLRLAYRLQLATGMRVSEVAGLKKEDILFNDTQAEIRLRQTKSGIEQKVFCAEKYCIDRLAQLVTEKKSGENLFFAASTLKKEAWKRGFQTHDLRRIYSRKQYAIAKKDSTAQNARNTVKEALRHSNPSVTYGYITGGFIKRKRGKK